MCVKVYVGLVLYSMHTIDAPFLFHIGVEDCSDMYLYIHVHCADILWRVNSSNPQGKGSGSFSYLSYVLCQQSYDNHVIAVQHSCTHSRSSNASTITVYSNPVYWIGNVK